eukprot:scaffold7789_cov376-Prasinococcus_capsulatus_cf.AAC.8
MSRADRQTHLAYLFHVLAHERAIPLRAGSPGRSQQQHSAASALGAGPGATQRDATRAARARRQHCRAREAQDGGHRAAWGLLVFVQRHRAVPALLLPPPQSLLPAARKSPTTQASGQHHRGPPTARGGRYPKMASNHSSFIATEWQLLREQVQTPEVGLCDAPCRRHAAAPRRPQAVVPNTQSPLVAQNTLTDGRTSANRDNYYIPDTPARESVGLGRTSADLHNVVPCAACLRQWQAYGAGQPQLRPTTPKPSSPRQGQPETAFPPWRLPHGARIGGVASLGGAARELVCRQGLVRGPGSLDRWQCLPGGPYTGAVALLFSATQLAVRRRAQRAGALPARPANRVPVSAPTG